MVFYIGADHKGFELKEQIKSFLNEIGYSFIDEGNSVLIVDDDYPDFAKKVAEKVSIEQEKTRGILVCGSGVGMAVTANKYKNVRAALVANSNQAFDSRNEDDANILVLAANYISFDEAKKIITTWIETPFSGEDRYVRRLKKIERIELNRSEEEQPPRDITWR